MVNPLRSRVRFFPTTITTIAGIGIGLVLGVAAATAGDQPLAADASTEPTSLTAIQSGVERLANRLQTLRDRAAERSQTRSSPGLHSLQSKVDELAAADDSVARLAKSVETLDERVGVLDKQLATLRDQVAALKAKRAGNNRP